MKCRNVRQRLSAYQDKELKPREQEEVRKHLLGCRSCREEHERLGRVWQALGDMQEISPEPGFYRQVLGNIDRSGEQGVSLALRRLLGALPSAAMASLILATGVVLGAYLGDFMGRPDFLPFAPSAASSGGTFLNSLKVFDPSPPGTLANGYLQLASTRETNLR
jgi:anti-sigma factor RsiW